MRNFLKVWKSKVSKVAYIRQFAVLYDNFQNSKSCYAVRRSMYIASISEVKLCVNLIWGCLHRFLQNNSNKKEQSKIEECFF